MTSTRLLRAALAAVAAVALIAVAGLPLYVFPPRDDVGPADVVYVIGPPTPPRLELAERLIDQGIAPRMLISVPDTGPQSPDRWSVCRRVYVECGHPEPFTTNGETALLTRYLDDRGLDSAVVITFTPHVTRTRYYFDRCVSHDTTVVAVDDGMSPTRWAYNYAYQSAAFVKAWLSTCADPETVVQG